MAINVHLLKIFHAVARSGSFSRAASELAISQPSVSIQVGELERQFGVELFEPAGKSVRLTEAGRTCFDYAGRILALMEEAQRAMDEVKGLGRGRLLVGATQTPGTYILPAMLGRLTEEVAILRGKLRELHLATHIETRSILTPQQIAEYDRLRGYTDDTSEDYAGLKPD